MTSFTRVFHSDLDDKWYYWPDAFDALVGPYDEYVEAHSALTAYCERQKRVGNDKEEVPSKAEDFTSPYTTVSSVSPMDPS